MRILQERVGTQQLFMNRRFGGGLWPIVWGTLLVLVGTTALFAPWLSRYLTSFHPNETHSHMAAMAPGVEDVPLEYRTYDGEREGFAEVDTDGSGYIECTRDSSQADMNAEGSISCPEVDVLPARFRFFRFLFSDYDGMKGTGDIPDGRLTEAEFPANDDQLEDAYRNLGFSGSARFQQLDEDGNGWLDPSEVNRRTRMYRLRTAQLIEFDLNGDLRISKEEFPGAPQTATFWLGTDSQGRDLLTRMIFGARISLMVGILATLISLLIGVGVGAISGYVGGRLDRALMGLVNVLYGLPFLLVVILILVWFGRSTVHLFLALGAVQWLTICRVVRGQVRTLREEEYIVAAESIGVPPYRVILRHILPNILGPVLAYASLMIPAVMQEEAFLSYLGLGVQAPDPSWGTLLSEGIRRIEDSWWMIVYPGVAFAMTVLALYVVGDSLRDRMDPHQRMERV